MPRHKYVRELKELALEVHESAQISRARNGHICVTFTGPKGSQKVFLSSTPSDHRNILNSRAEMRQAARKAGCL